MGGGHRVDARKIASFLAVTLLCAGFLSPEYRAFAGVPSRLTLPAGDVMALRGVPGLVWSARGGVRETVGPKAVEVTARSDGQLALLLGGVPMKRVDVRVAPRHVVSLGGQAIGVVVRGKGTTIVGFDRIQTTEGETHTPGQGAGLRVGDQLLSVDGNEVTGDEQVADLVDRAGRGHRSVRLNVARDGRPLGVSVRPTFDRELGRYRLGIFVRNHMAGVGTLTFSDDRGRFAALGHRVALSRSGVAPSSGVILPAAIVGVQRARRGKPGQKIGVVSAQVIGRIERNGDVGVGGVLPAGRLPGRRMPLASASQVHPGGATFYTVLRDGRVRAFSVQIERVTTERRAGSKSLVIHVTDRRLLRECGGIVQGMSGSPIVQDGRIAGAVTHVFIHDPTRGYGTFADWMHQDLVSRSPGAGVRHLTQASDSASVA